MEKLEVLRYYFGYEKFRDGQEEIIDSIISKKNTLCILPTGGGKSLCFQVPALVFDGLTIVISPLISLMIDQVSNLNKKAISARYLNSTLSFNEQKEIMDMLINNKIKLLYIAPEKLKNNHFKELIKKIKVSQIVLDEAHSLSLYGHDFRPDYKLIPEFLKIFDKSKPVVSAFTATASQSVIDDIKELTNLNYEIFKFGFDRPNLYYEVIKSKDEFSDLINTLKIYPNVSTIIYTLTRRQAEILYYKLDKLNFSVSLYHAGLDKEIKDYYNDLFMSNKKNIMIATNAYGMGIDKPDIRLVINLGYPMSLEDLSQQQGRCSRDGESGRCILIYNDKDIKANMYFINKVDDYDIEIENKKILKKIKKEKLKEVVGYAETKRCLHEYLVSHFGELYMSYCNNCSNCMRETKTINYLKEAKLIIDTIKLTKQRYGSSTISKIITGSKDSIIKDRKLNKVLTYNKTIYSQDDIKEVIVNMVNDGYIDKTYDEYPLLKLNEKSENIYKLEKYDLKQ